MCVCVCVCVCACVCVCVFYLVLWGYNYKTGILHFVFYHLHYSCNTSLSEIFSLVWANLSRSCNDMYVLVDQIIQLSKQLPNMNSRTDNLQILFSTRSLQDFSFASSVLCFPEICNITVAIQTGQTEVNSRERERLLILLKLPILHFLKARKKITISDSYCK